jgi:uncharacterized protein (TIGR00299 family) protein
MGRILHFDCVSGISGDMTVAALISAGADRTALLESIETLEVPGFELRITETSVNGITATDFSVLAQETHDHPHRCLPDIERIIDSSGITPKAKELSGRIFHCLGEAESKIHGQPLEQVTFHEVGAVDSIVDIVATAVCVDLLEVDRITASAVPVGRGFTRSAHGLIPVPAPATVQILKGVPIYDSGIESELVTPTGAAILRSLVESFGTLPPMRLEGCGYGAGKKRFDHPNLLRVLIGTADIDTPLEKLIVLETNIDDMNPEIYSHLLPLLLERGALDAFLTNVVMKKGRPGVQLSVVCRPGDEGALEELIFRETTTLGVRRYPVNRHFLRRRTSEIDTDLGSVRVKLVYDGGILIRAAPEYEECRRIAVERGLSLREVYDRLQAALRGTLNDVRRTSSHE